ncbi:MAG: YgjV family protein [Erysipelotrichaceae bacterium]|nr:YgjV family protein [Erysipelotrichaceae bacterium]
MNEVLIANILMIIGEAILFIASSRKNKKTILIYQIVSMLVMTVASYLLKGYGAIVMDVIGITRNLLSINGIASRWLTYLFISAAIIFGILFNNKGLLGYLPIVANVSQSLIIINRKSTARQIRFVCAFSSFCWAIYNFAIKGYAGVITNLVNSISYLYHAIRMKEEDRS